MPLALHALKVLVPCTRVLDAVEDLGHGQDARRDAHASRSAVEALPTTSLPAFRAQILVTNRPSQITAGRAGARAVVAAAPQDLDQLVGRILPATDRSRRSDRQERIGPTAP